MSLFGWLKSAFFKREVPQQEVVTPPPADELSIWSRPGEPEPRLYELNNQPAWGKPVEYFEHKHEVTPEAFAPVTQLCKEEASPPAVKKPKKKKKAAKKKTPPKIVHARKKVADKGKKH